MRCQWNLKSKLECRLFHSQVCHRLHCCAQSHISTPITFSNLHPSLQSYSTMRFQSYRVSNTVTQPLSQRLYSKAYIAKEPFKNPHSTTGHQDFTQILEMQLYIFNFFRFPTQRWNNFLPFLQPTRGEASFFKLSVLRNIILLSTSRNWLHFKSARF